MLETYSVIIKSHNQAKSLRLFKTFWVDLEYQKGEQSLFANFLNWVKSA
jgi:hypothetical protein